MPTTRRHCSPRWTSPSVSAPTRWRPARATLRAYGVQRVPRGPRADTRANPAGLTARQLEVLALLREGLTNAEIAKRLVLSVKTVNHHVSAVLDKLGVDNRHDAVRVAARTR